jgi:hypothetical protein
MDPKITEKISTPVAYSDKNVDGGVSNATVATANMYTSLEKAFVGDKTYGQVQKMTYGKINGKQTKTAFGDIDVVVGYNFVADEDKQFGIGLRVGAPSGNTPTAEYILEPVVGRGGNWAVGGQLCGNVRAWEGDSGDKSLNVYLDGHVMTLLKKKMNRSFDLKSKPGSKYMLAGTFSGGVYQAKINNLINHTTLEAESKYNAMGDVTVGLCYETGNWAVDLGYNGWGHSAEKLTLTGTLAADTYGLLSRDVRLYDGTPAVTNEVAKDASINQQGTGAAVAAGSYVAQTDLDIDSAVQQSAFTSKVFGGIGYNWKDSDYCPHLRVFGEFEYSHSDNNALPSWAVGVEGGVSF